ncbi:MAG TPA: hypothetical protein VJN18_35600 [Polyangiaceae bacterium]|nr:hypothetical protein [Polyangiaceae bacterium]
MAHIEGHGDDGWNPEAEEAARLRAELATVTGERDRFHDDYWSRVAECDRLSRQFEAAMAVVEATDALMCDANAARPGWATWLERRANLDRVTKAPGR